MCFVLLTLRIARWRILFGAVTCVYKVTNMVRCAPAGGARWCTRTHTDMQTVMESSDNGYGLSKLYTGHWCASDMQTEEGAYLPLYPLPPLWPLLPHPLPLLQCQSRPPSQSRLGSPLRSHPSAQSPSLSRSLSRSTYRPCPLCPLWPLSPPKNGDNGGCAATGAPTLVAPLGQRPNTSVSHVADEPS